MDQSNHNIVNEGFNPDDKMLRKENFTLTHIIEVMESGYSRFTNWIKKSIAMMIIFVLIGGAGGLYIAKFIYDFRMSEICKVGGFVYDKKVYNVSLRP